MARRTAADGDATGEGTGAEPDGAIAWFRAASPYIRAHRGRTLVVAVPGRALAGAGIETLVHDLALLHHLGLRLVVCFGLRTQVDLQLAAAGHADSPIVDGRRVTDDAALRSVVTEAGLARTELEARLSAGLPNTPMAGARLIAASGNLVTARPFGVHDGVDFRHTGTVREIQAGAVRSLLDAGHVVLQAPLGHSLTGDVFNLPVDEVAAEMAAALGADKLAYLVDALPREADGSPVRQASASRLEALARAGADAGDGPLERVLHRAVAACRAGVERVHLLEIDDPEALLRELFTRDGGGTLVTAERWESVREATIEDVGGLIGLIAPLQENGTLAARSREALELDIERFVVCERDGAVVACAAGFELDGGRAVEIASVAVHPGYRGAGRADRLLAHLEARARAAGAERALILSTRTGHWFLERGYVETSPEALPPGRRDAYNRQRNSKVYVKALGDGLGPRRGLNRR